MPRTSAGLLMYRVVEGKLQVLLAHPGGPFFKNKDDDTWTIPKGEPDEDEELFATAVREFAEETSLKPQGLYIPLQPIQQKGGKIVHAWAFAGDCQRPLDFGSGRAGQLVTAYALTYAVGSPILAVTLSNIDRCWCSAARPRSGTCLAASWRTGSVR